MGEVVGGAILIVSSTSIVINGNPAILANGAAGSSGGPGGGGGSGGAIRLIAPTITGSGQLLAQGGNPGNYAGDGAPGRIRLEATTPIASTGFPQSVFPPAGQPTLAITSVGGIAAPANPVGSVLAAPDILLPTGTTNPVEVALTASNIPVGTTVLVTATPQSGTKTTATSTGLSGTPLTATASITLTLTQTNVLTATATFPLVASAGTGPLYADGEEVQWVRVASSLGGPSTVTYITASGKEVPAAAIASLAQ